MKTLFKLKLISGLFLCAIFTSCNNGSAATDDSTATDTTTMTDTNAATASVAAFKPFDVLERTEKIKSYAKWKPFFDSLADYRKSNGMEDYVLGRRMDDSNNVVLVEKITDMSKAKVSLSNADIKNAIKKAGVVSGPTDTYWHVIRQTPHPEIKDWVEVTHKVKNFDAWLKVYDGEGTAQRESEGVVDEAITRGINDSDLVRLIFDVTDAAKAKAAINSDAKKKLMMSAGVIGKPTVEFYTEAK